MTRPAAQWRRWLRAALGVAVLALIIFTAWFPGRFEGATGVRIPTAELAVGFFALHVALTYWPVPQLRALRARGKGVPLAHPAPREAETVDKALQRVAALRAATTEPDGSQ